MVALSISRESLPNLGRSVWPVCIREEREGEGIWKVSIFNLGGERRRRRRVSLPTAPPTNLESEREWIMDGEGRKKRGWGTYRTIPVQLTGRTPFT